MGSQARMQQAWPPLCCLLGGVLAVAALAPPIPPPAFATTAITAPPTIAALVQPCPAYTCTSCGRDMVVLVGEAPAESLCHRCRMLPGWHGRPEVVALCETDEQVLATAGEEVGHA